MEVEAEVGGVLTRGVGDRGGREREDRDPRDLRRTGESDGRRVFVLLGEG